MAKAKANFSFDVIKRNLFWILVPIAILCVWGLFYVAYSKALASYKTRVDALEKLRKDVGSVKSDSKHPNDETLKKIAEQEAALRGLVHSAWAIMDEDQKAKCTWSTELKKPFLDVVYQMKRLDAFKNIKDLEWYNTYVERQLPEFLTMVKRRSVEVRKIDLTTGKPTVDANGQPEWRPIDPYVVDPKKIIDQTRGSLGMGMMGGMGGSSMGGSSMGGMSSGSSGMSMSSGGMSMSGGGMSMSGRGGMSMSGGGMGMSGSSGSGGGAMGGSDFGTGMALDQIYDSESQRVVGIVDWPAPEIFKVITWQKTPSSAQVWYAQEDIWVYEALINVIRNVNDRVKATGNHNAAVKRINGMLIGRDAAMAVGFNPMALKPLGVLSASDASAMGPMMGPGMSSSGSGSSSMGSPGSSSMGPPMMGGMMGSSSSGGGMGINPANMTEEQIIQLIRMYRYVDKDLKPLMDTDPPPFAEFNMMAVCLELIVDQRKIPDILVECANSSMPIKVIMVNYSPGYIKPGVLGVGMGGGMGGSGMMGSSGGSSSGGPGGGMMGSPGGSSSGGPGGGSGMGTGMGAGSGQSELMAQLAQYSVGGKMGPYGSDAVMIQIVGTINIFNDPDPTLLATGADAKGSGITGGLTPAPLPPPSGISTDTSADTQNETSTPSGNATTNNATTSSNTPGTTSVETGVPVSVPATPPAVSNTN